MTPPATPKWALRGLGGTIAVVFVLGVVSAVFVEQGTSGPPHPAEWDPRVTDIAAFVEESRGLEFDHPVFVDFLTPEEYTRQTRADQVEVTDETTEGFTRLAGLYRALGIAEGELDLLGAQGTTSDAGTLAFYNVADTRIRVRGAELTPGLRVTIAHELTHALQAQNFDLDRLTEGREGQLVAFRSLIEGDAIRVENDYVARGLDDPERAEYLEEIERSRAEAEAALSDVPPVLRAFFDAPYALGQPLVDLLDAIDGNDAVDDALSDPPASEEALLDPVAYLEGTVGTSGEDGPLQIGGLADDAQVVDEGEFGVVAWYLVLAERIDPLTALTAADGWANDGFSSFLGDDTLCVKARFQGDTDDDVEEMRAALEAWASTLPADMASVEPGDGSATFTSCDPGPEVETGTTGRIGQALVLPSVRSVFVADFVTELRLDVTHARCASASLLGRVGYERFVADDTQYFTSEEFRSAVARSIETCR